MLAQWLRERDERKRQERIEREQEESAEEVREWEAWYERWQAAKQEGRPFDEPPPSQRDKKAGK